MSYGHGLSVSLLQMARAYTIFARDGDMIPVTFQKTDDLGRQRVISDKTAQQLRVMMESVTQPACNSGTCARLSRCRKNRYCT
jgi:cell division protein FtsI (penicillin-binding protein 3)